MVLVLMMLAAPVAAAQSTAPAPAMPKRLRIALVPLDDRPVCLQYPEMLARIAHAEVVAPPLSNLGRFTTPGDTAAIAEWLRSQDWRTFDALVVSIDMLAYGGLVASRVPDATAQDALARLGVLEHIRKASPSLPIHAFSVIMRLAPTADGRNEAFREPLARYAELASGTTNADEANELAVLTSRIPESVRQDYLRARARNRQVNLAAVDLAARKVVDSLVVSQDDAKPRGVHLADRAAIERVVRGKNLGARVGIQPGADEVAMLLLARAVLDARGLKPVVRAIYPTERARTMVAPFEDRPLHDTVAFQLAAAGATPASADAKASDLDLYVFASRHDAGVPATFAARIVRDVKAGARAIVADVDPKGDVQGASPAFTEALLEAKVFPALQGYASWNTAGNTLGTAIAHGLLAWAGATLMTRCTSPEWSALAGAQVTFLLHRLVNDYAYQGVERPALNANLRQAGRATLWLKDHAADVASGLQSTLAPRLAQYARVFAPVYTPAAPAPTDVAVQVGEPRNLRVSLPWDRTFEARISFEVPVAGLSGPARRLPVCAVTP